MNIEIDNESRQWIESKGRHLTVKTVEVKGCCAPGIQELIAIPGKPKPLERYNEFNVDHLSIYVQKNVHVKDKILLKLKGFGFLKSISAKV